MAKMPRMIYNKKHFVNNDGLTSTKEHIHIDKKGMIKEATASNHQPIIEKNDTVNDIKDEMNAVAK